MAKSGVAQSRRDLLAGSGSPELAQHDGIRIPDAKLLDDIEGAAPTARPNVP